MSVDPIEFPGWAASWTPPWDGEIWEFAEKYLSLPGGYAIPGPFRIQPSRWMMEIFRALKDDETKEVTAAISTQMGKSLMADIMVPYWIMTKPANIMWVQQTDDDAKDHCKMRLMPLLRAVQTIANLMPRGKGEVSTSKIFFGNLSLLVVGANLNSLQAKTVRYLINSELWLPQWRGLYSHAVRRLGYNQALGQYKIFNESQPGIEGDEIHARYVAGTQEVRTVDCGGGQAPLKWHMKTDDGHRAGVVWDENALRSDGTWDKARVLETVRYCCPRSGIELPDDAKTRALWNRTTEYQQTNENGTRSHRSFSVNALSDRPMKIMVEMWLEAQAAMAYGDKSKMKEFTNKEAGEFWKEKPIEIMQLEDSDYDLADYENGEEIPNEQDRIASIDVQQDHLWIEVRAIDTESNTKQLYYGRVETGQMAEHIRAKYKVKPVKTVIDGRYNIDLVNRLAAEFDWTVVQGQTRKVFIRQSGDGQKYTTYVSDPTQVLVGGTKTIFKFYFSGDPIKDILASRFAKPSAWQHARDVNAEYLDQTNGAEAKEEKTPGNWTWVRKKKNNHGWDTSVQIVAMMLQMNLINPPSTTEKPSDPAP